MCPQQPYSSQVDFVVYLEINQYSQKWEEDKCSKERHILLNNEIKYQLWEKACRIIWNAVYKFVCCWGFLKEMQDGHRCGLWCTLPGGLQAGDTMGPEQAKGNSGFCGLSVCLCRIPTGRVLPTTWETHLLLSVCGGGAVGRGQQTLHICQWSK